MTITEVRARFQILIGLEIFYGAMFGTNICFILNLEQTTKC